jgi:PPM family protein phosphatase
MLCSDGLWGALSDDTIIEILNSRSVSEAVPELVERALRTAGERSDNVTVLAVEWESADAVDNPRAVSTTDLGDEVFASTIQAGIGDASADEMDDAEIERSIREINEAIQRTSKKKR